MTVRSVKRRESSPPANPETEKPVPGASPEARRPDPEVPQVGKPEPRPLERDRGAHSRPSIVFKKKGTLTIILPSQTVSPIKYGSFQTPSVGMTIEVGGPDDAMTGDEVDLAEAAVASLQELQEQLFNEELKTYLRRAATAYKAGQEAFGEDDS